MYRSAQKNSGYATEEILGKSQKWVEAEPSTLTPLPQINLSTLLQTSIVWSLLSLQSLPQRFNVNI